jgi:hypothetical protein
MNRKKLALFIALIVLVLAVVWSFFSAPRLKTVSPSASAPGQAPRAKSAAAVLKPAENPVKAEAKPAALTDDRTLRLDLLEREQSGFKGYRRNLFKPLFIDEIKQLKLKSVATKPLPLPPVAVVAQPPPAPIPAPDPAEVEAETRKKTLAQFTYLGFLKKDNRKTIFLSKDKEIILVRKGEKFAKLYEAVEITEKALTIRVISSKDEIVIPLNENKPLAPAKK